MTILSESSILTYKSLYIYICTENYKNSLTWIKAYFLEEEVHCPGPRAKAAHDVHANVSLTINHGVHGIACPNETCPPRKVQMLSPSLAPPHNQKCHLDGLQCHIDIRVVGFPPQIYREITCSQKNTWTNWHLLRHPGMGHTQKMRSHWPKVSESTRRNCTKLLPISSNRQNT